MKTENNNESMDDALVGTINKMMTIIVILVISIVVIPFLVYFLPSPKKELVVEPGLPTQSSNIANSQAENSSGNFWKPASLEAIQDQNQKARIEYGRDLIAHTAKYLGPKGSVAKINNGMNCQNCHLDAGTKVFGNNFGSVASLYPKMRARSGSVEDIFKRINDCFERSLNGKALDTNSAELVAIKAYIEYIGSNVEKGKKAEGSGFKELAFLDRSADASNGKLVYDAKCESCHQSNGEGIMTNESKEYTYPPLWGKNSYNDGAGLYRISNFAKYVKYNMPLGASHQSPLITDEEAWDVAAYINSQPRPHKNTRMDWPDISKKPIDYPFGPYSDKFSEEQHKYGPFKPIEESRKKNK